MSKKSKSVPVNPAAGEFESGIAIFGKVVVDGLSTFEELEESHRDNFHLFLLQEKGTTSIEIDFQTYKIEPNSVAYIHPSQIHRLVAFENVTFSGWAIDNENLNPEYLKLLEDITPSKPLLLEKDEFSIIHEMVSICDKLFQKEQGKLQHSLLRDSCNALVALVISQFLNQSDTVEKHSRFENITKTFKTALEQNFTTLKKPAEYAKLLHISIPYLNECVKSATGYSVSYHIQQRVVLEAKRLLYHSDQSVKEISAVLGYDDYPYFSRLFTKVAGIAPLAFRKKNLD